MLSLIKRASGPDCTAIMAELLVTEPSLWSLFSYWAPETPRMSSWWLHTYILPGWRGMKYCMPRGQKGKPRQSSITGWHATESEGSFLLHEAPLLLHFTRFCLLYCFTPIQTSFIQRRFMILHPKLTFCRSQTLTASVIDKREENNKNEEEYR